MSGVTGQRRLVAVAVKLPDLITKEVRQEVRGGFDEPIEAFKADVTEAIREHLPKRGGYAGVFGGSFRIRRSGQGLKITLTGTAAGKGSKRDSQALDAGRLKHPVFGRRRHGKARPWVTQAIPPDFWSLPARKLAANIGRYAEPVAKRIAARVEKQL